jgi:hypothetical protein
LLTGPGLIEGIASLRSGMFQLPYGDQGIIIRADLIQEAGGFPEIPIMEEVELIPR